MRNLYMRQSLTNARYVLSQFGAWLNLKKTFRYAVGAVFMSAFVWVINVVWYKPFSIDMFYEKALLEYAFAFPEEMTKARLLGKWGLNAKSDKINSLAEEDMQAFHKSLSKNYEILLGYRLNQQTKEQQVSSQIFKLFLEKELIIYDTTTNFNYYQYSFSHLHGPHIDFPVYMVNSHSIQRVRDARDYIDRVAAFQQKTEQLIQFIQIQEEYGAIPPKAIVAKAIEQIEEFVNMAPADNELCLNFAQKIKGLPNMTENVKLELMVDLKEEIEYSMYPAYQKLLGFLYQLLATAPEEPGVWQLKEAAFYYVFISQKYTTTEKTPEEYFNYADDEIERIHQNLRVRFDQLGLPADSSSLGLLKMLIDAPGNKFGSDRYGQKRLVEGLKKLRYSHDPKMESLFGKIPAMSAQIKTASRMRAFSPDFLEFEPPTLDLSRKAALYLNPNLSENLPQFALPALMRCYDLPGLNLQKSRAILQENLPTFRKYIGFSAFEEGWAYYAETVLAENGYYDDPMHDIGRLYLSLIDAAKINVDRGIHLEQWKRADAVAYMVNTTGISESYAALIVDEISVFPGQQLARFVGRDMFLEARALAQSGLGAKFSLQKFHEFILDGGPMPYSVFMDEAAAFVEKGKGAGLNLPATGKRKDGEKVLPKQDEDTLGLKNDTLNQVEAIKNTENNF